MGKGMSIARLRDFDCIDLRAAVEIATKDDPFAIGSKIYVRLQSIIVPGHVDQSLGPEAAIGLRREEIEPFSIGGVGHHVGRAAVAREKFAVRRDIKMDRPLVASERKADLFARSDLDASQEKAFAARHLEIE